MKKQIWEHEKRASEQDHKIHRLKSEIGEQRRETYRVPKEKHHGNIVHEG